MREIPLNKLAETLGASLDQTVRAVKVELFNGVIDDTRVDTGRAKGNWVLSSGSPVTETIERLDPNGSSAKTDVAGGVTPDDIDYLSNNLPYIAVLEEKDAMIQKNVARLERNIREAVQKNR